MFLLFNLFRTIYFFWKSWIFKLKIKQKKKDMKMRKSQKSAITQRSDRVSTPGVQISNHRRRRREAVFSSSSPDLGQG
ncbi:unnamed protein product [Arabidopsis halleri]